MTPERFGELIGIVAWELVKEASEAETIEFMAKWPDALVSMPGAIVEVRRRLAAMRLLPEDMKR